MFLRLLALPVPPAAANAGRPVERTHGDGDPVLLDRVPEEERAANRAEAAPDVFGGHG